MTIESNGRVGIGTATPNSLLNVAGTASSANSGLVSIGSATASFDGTTAGHFAGSASGTELAINAPSGYGGNLMDAQVNGSSVFSVNTSGNITAGNYSGNYVTAQTLDASVQLITESNGVTSYTGSSTTSATIANAGGQVTSQDYSWGDGNVTRYQMQVNNSSGLAQYGYVGTVSVTGASNYSPAIVFGQSTGSSAYNERMRIDQNGRLGVGTMSPSYELHASIPGSGAVAGFTNSAGTCSLTPSSSSASWSCTSDVRLKKDIEDISGADALDGVSQLQAVTYVLKKGDDGRRHTGYIAQEVQKVAPEFVTTGPDGLLQVSYTGFIPWITEAIKELSHKQSRDLASVNAASDAKDKQIESLKQENAQIKAYLCAKDPTAPFCQ